MNNLDLFSNKNWIIVFILTCYAMYPDEIVGFIKQVKDLIIHKEKRTELRCLIKKDYKEIKSMIIK